MMFDAICPRQQAINIDELSREAASEAHAIALYVDALIANGALNAVPEQLLMLCREFRTIHTRLQEAMGNLVDQIAVSDE